MFRYVISALFMFLVQPVGAIAEDYVPPDSGVVNVTSFGATGNGVTDDTAAINNAIKSGVYNVIYFPNGTYLVSNRLEWRDSSGNWNCCRSFQGQSRDGTIIKLKNNAAGYTDPNVPRPVIMTASGNFDGLGPADWPTNGTGNQAFVNDILNLTVNTGAGNPGAIGINYLDNNQGSVENVRIVSGDGQGHAGLYMVRQWSGPSMISKVTIEGFNYGVRVGDNFYHVTLEHITLKNQTVAGVYNNGNAISLRDIVSTNSVPAVRNDGNISHLVVLDSTLTGGSSGVSAIENSNSAQLFARNIVTSGYRSAITNQGSMISGNSVTEFVSGTKTSLFPSPAQSLNLPIQETPEYTNSNPLDWANVVSYGATLNGGADDTAAIQNAIDSGKPVVYLPKGTYNLSSTISLRGNLRKIIGYYSTINAPTNIVLFRTENINSDFVMVEKLSIDLPNVTPSSHLFEQASPKTLVLKRVHSWFPPMVKTLTGAGPLFMQDTCCGHLEVNGTNVWARQLNLEINPLHFLNNGGQLWALGLKTEGSSLVGETKNGGKTELLGGMLYPVSGGTPVGSSIPAFNNIESNHSLVYANSAVDNYSIHVKETRGGVTATLANSSLPSRGTGSFIPLHTGYPTVLYPLGTPTGSPSVDTTPPSVFLTAPTNGSTVSGTVTVSATASDNVGVVGVQFKLDGANLGAEDTSSPYNLSWDTTGASNGSHTLTAFARDAAGNSATASSVTVTVSNTTPAPPSTITADQVTASPVIDGQLSEGAWNLASSIGKNVIGTSNNTATFDVLWDNTYLYVGVKVLDATLNNDSTYAWDDDSIEIYIDANHSHGTTYDGTDFQFVKGYNDAALFATGNNTSGVLHNWASIPGGYTIEMAIPWTKLGITPSANLTIGFDIGVNDDDNGALRDSQSMWNGTASNYQDTSAFGHAVLAAATPSTTPIAHWKLDETSGMTGVDSSGDGHTGTLVNGPVWTAGRIGGAID